MPAIKCQNFALPTLHPNIDLYAKIHFCGCAFKILHVICCSCCAKECVCVCECLLCVAL